MEARAIRKALQRSDHLDFDDTPLYARIYALADARAGKPLPRAMVPAILDSPRSREKTDHGVVCYARGRPLSALHAAVRRRLWQST
jgi:hypothetical protein